MNKCENCKIMEECRNNPTPACCIWYMNNVVCGDKKIEDCTDYQPIK